MTLWLKCLNCHIGAPAGAARYGPCDRAYRSLLAQATHDLWVMGNRLMGEGR